MILKRLFLLWIIANLATQLTNIGTNKYKGLLVAHLKEL